MTKPRLPILSARACRAVLLLGALLHAGAGAAEAPVTPGSVLESLEGGRAPRFSAPPQVVLPQPPAPSAHDPRARRFRVNAFAMSGNTVFREQRLKRVVERFVDLELNLHDLHRAADAVTEFYHARGYTLARAMIPAQKVVNGVVTVHIVEGRIGQLRFTGNSRFSDEFLMTRSGMMQPGALVTTARLEHDLLLLNDIPGLSARVILAPGAEFGATDAEVRVTESLFSGSVHLNNFGRRETGQEKLEATLNVNSPLGWGDQLSLSGSSTEHGLVRYWKAGYSLPLGVDGMRLYASSSHAAYDVSGALAVLGITGEIRTTEAGLSYPLVRGRQTSQWFDVGVRHSHLVQSALGTTMSDTRISVMNVAWRISHIHDDSAVTNASAGLTTNFKRPKTATQQDAVLARLEFDVNHLTPFMRRWDLYLRGNYVYSSGMLPDTEKFSLGGPGSVRAYRTSELRGDSGMLGTAELRHPFELGGRMGIFRLTADVGQITYKMSGFRDSSDHLRSVGVGAAFYPFQGVTASVDWATAVGKGYAATDGRKNRVWMNVSASF